MNKINNYILISEICNKQLLFENLQHGFITKKEFYELTSENESKFETLIKKELKKILDIYNNRYSKEYGKITGTYISFFYEKPYLVGISISAQNQKMFSFYVIQTNIEYNINNKKFTPDGFYIFYKVDSSGKNVKKIAEGNETEEYNIKSKYGELLNIKIPLKYKKRIKL